MKRAIRLVLLALLPTLILLPQALRGEWVMEHGEPVYALATYVQGHEEMLVTAGASGTLRIWRAYEGLLRHTMPGHTAGVNTLEIDTTRGRILSASFDRTARLWDTGGAALRVFRGHTSRVREAVFSPDANLVATASFDSTVRIWSVDSDSALHVLRGHTDWVYSVAFSPDGSKVLSVSNDATGRIWDVGSGELLQTLRGHGDRLVWGSWSPDGSTVVTAGFDGRAILWEAATGDSIRSFRHTARISTARFSEDGARLLTSSFDSTAAIWRVSDGERLFTLRGHADAVTDAIWCRWLAETEIATASFDGTARTWSEQSGEMVPSTEHTHRARVSGIACVRSFFISTSFDSTARSHTPVTGVDHGTELGLHGESIKVVPLPAEDEVMFQYGLERTSDVRITLHDAMGREMKVIEEKGRPAGMQMAHYRVGDLPTGVYHVTISREGSTPVRGMLIRR